MKLNIQSGDLITIQYRADDYLYHTFIEVIFKILNNELLLSIVNGKIQNQVKVNNHVKVVNYESSYDIKLTDGEYLDFITLLKKINFSNLEDNYIEKNVCDGGGSKFIINNNSFHKKIIIGNYTNRDEYNKVINYDFEPYKKLIYYMYEIFQNNSIDAISDKVAREYNSDDTSLDIPSFLRVQI